MQTLRQRLREGTSRASQFQLALPEMSKDTQERAEQAIETGKPKIGTIRETQGFVARCFVAFWLAIKTFQAHPKKLKQNERYAFWSFLFWMLLSWYYNPYGSFGLDTQSQKLAEASTGVAFYFGLLSLLAIPLMRMKERERLRYES